MKFPSDVVDRIKNSIRKWRGELSDVQASEAALNCLVATDLVRALAAEWRSSGVEDSELERLKTSLEQSQVAALEAQIRTLTTALDEAVALLRAGLGTHGDPCTAGEACTFVKNTRALLARLAPPAENRTEADKVGT